MKIKKFLCKIGIHNKKEVGLQTAIGVVDSWSGSPINRVVYSCKHCGKKSYFCTTIGFNGEFYIKWE